jgi:hypothetical protein
LAETLLPLKLLEAMAMGKTVLVSDVAAMAEVVTDERNGLVFEKGNHDDFLRKLEAMAASGGGLENLGRRARQDVLDKYSWETSRRQLQSVYDALMKLEERLGPRGPWTVAADRYCLALVGVNAGYDPPFRRADCQQHATDLPAPGATDGLSASVPDRSPTPFGWRAHASVSTPPARKGWATRLATSALPQPAPGVRLTPA